MFPDYEPALKLLGGWIAAGAELKAGESCLLEPDLPESPDRVAALFENGGPWNYDSGEQKWALLLITRTAKASDARALIRACLEALMAGYKAAKPADLLAAGVQSVAVELPAFRGHDEKGRALMDAGIQMTCYVQVECGVAR